MSHIEWIGATATAVVAFAGLLVTAAGGFLAAKDSSGKLQAVPAMLAVMGLLVGGAAIAIQLKSSRQSEKDAADQKVAAQKAYAQVAETRKLVGQSSTNIDDLSALNALSPNGRYHVQLSVNPTAALACAAARKIDAQFRGALSSGGVRVLNSGKGSQPFILAFGYNLTLAGAEIYQRLAIDHSLANGLPPIEAENPSEPVVDCSPELSGHSAH